MYITLEKNSLGDIQIEDQLIKKIIHKDIKSNIDETLNLDVRVVWEHETTLFINIVINIEDRNNFSIDQNKIINSTYELIKKTIGIQPKTVSVSFV
ncbi:MMB_0454 family protein [Spiroplasma turonicum]|uniref:Asp23/Gls24 family envelope stress response protein n=1 Tax=Spiroplasma turonicum TaxID=216946 RepID=A0A0K1P6U3_9MOLU|nr:hypothetical protein [Spiroplasma turonicum]AKU80026.1 hypothetical protein STURON_00780 [Spiroplasma turonicum]ALX71028.1 hypothetical protein STURO_v1c07770 [Spiroplasma turonicum]